MKGWTENISGLTEFSALPEAAQEYVKRIESLLNIPILWIGTGPGSTEQIIRSPNSSPFAKRGRRGKRISGRRAQAKKKAAANADAGGKPSPAEVAATPKAPETKPAPEPTTEAVSGSA
eukprot:Trichotokara_eunicae@DN10460_c0_g1_i1.p1